MNQNAYPAEAGFKTSGTSEIAARIVNRDPTRKLDCMINLTLCSLLLAESVVADEASALVEESVLYVRPRVSELVAMGILVKGPSKTASVCGRSAHTLEPSPDLLAMLARRDIDLADDVQLVGAVGGIILDRLEDARRAAEIATKGVA